MRNILFVLFFISIIACEEEEICDCEYIVFDSDPTNNYQWTESFRSTLDASCENEVLSESTFTDSDGEKWYSRTEIQCK